MKLSKEEIEKLADLAKLQLSDEEINLYQEQLKDVLTYVEKINELDLEKIKESLTGAEDSKLGPRPDKVEASQPEVIKQACQMEGEYMAAPKVFDN